jgi:hypothetical protein
LGAHGGLLKSGGGEGGVPGGSSLGGLGLEPRDWEVMKLRMPCAARRVVSPGSSDLVIS